jgi:hypothetical protein
MSTICGVIIEQKGEAAEITEAAHREGWKPFNGAAGCTVGVGFSELLHWLRHNPSKRSSLSQRLSTAIWWLQRCVASPIRRR